MGMIKKLVQKASPWALAAALFSSPAYSPGSPTAASPNSFAASSATIIVAEESEEEIKQGKAEAKEEQTLDTKSAEGENLEQKTTLRSASRNTPVRDLTFRLNLEYDFWGGKKIERATSEGQIKDVDLRPQALDVSLNLGLDGYLVLGAGVASTDSATSFNKPANFSAVRNNVRLGAGYEINSGYRGEVEGILIRHAELLPGIQARVIGDLFGVNYGPINDVDVQLGVNLIQRIPHLTAQVGTRFLNRYYTSLSTQFSTKEAQVAFTTALCHEVERVRVKGCLGTEVFYHKFEEGQEQGFLTKLKLELPEFPYDRRLR